MTSTTLREMLVKQEPRNVSYCYVCSGPRAEYTLFSKPYGDHPFFPFLEHHQPPEGAESMRPDGRVLTCLVCYTFLTQQWDSYEKSKTPQNKRLYWLKRNDGGPFAGMDLNLQQDYESLFETSNACPESDSRPKQKHRSHYLPNAEGKPKLNERSEQGYPSSFSFSSRSSDKIESPSNILDLSLPARTPSRTSNSSPAIMNLEVCYMCGQESKTVVNIFAKPISNCPYFPSLMSHQRPPNAKPMDSHGKVYACDSCHRILIQQWDFYQRKNIPQNERIYQLKIIANVASKNDQTNKSFICYTCGTVTQISVQRFIHAYPEKSGDPFFSFLLNLNPHSGANKLVNGKASVCSLCYKTLLRQLRVYEVSNTPEEKRKYKIVNELVPENFSVLRQHLKSGGQSQDSDVKYNCYLCECVTDSLLSVNTLPLSEMHFPFIRSMPKPSNACPIGNDGHVKICNQCHTSLTYQFEAFGRAHIPIPQRQYKINSKLSSENHYHENSIHLPVAMNASQSVINENSNEFLSRKSDMCSLCERPLSNENACYIDTVPQEKNMYFPSIALLLKSSSKGIDQYGRVLACNQCHLILKNQWEVFESAHVPHSQRQYEIFPPQMEHDRSVNYNDIHMANTSAALHIQVSSPDLKVDLTKIPNIEPLLTTVNTLSVTTITSTNASASNSPQMMDHKSSKYQSNVEESIPRIYGPLDVPITRPLLLAPIYCYVCSEFNVSGLTYTIKSLPTTPVGVDKPPEEVPFFPFLTKHVPPDGEKLRNDGSALVCMFCYYSLISQWLAYESSPYPEDSNRWHRRYNTHNFVCYICGITTYRKRVCTISVKDFPFLLDHSRPSGALTVLNGECVVTCQTCFESITSQWKDFERMKVPVEMRKYNWIVMPAPPDDENSRGCQILTQESSGSASNLSQADSEQVHGDDQGIPSGLKPPPHLSVQSAYGLTKPIGRNVISPVHQSSSHSNAAFSPFGNNVNSALNATRTSSFAAALRKLAKQAVDPVTEKELSPISPASSPASSQQSSHSRHHASMPVYLNSHSSNPSGHRASPPVVTVTPMQGSQGKALDLGRYSNNSRNGNLSEPVSLKIENSKLSSSSDKRADSGGNKHMPPITEQMSLRHEHSMLPRGFQPYRNSEEHHSTPPQVYNPSPPPTTMSGYPYHPSFGPSSQLPPQPYRLEESVYMERYGLLRPSAMPYPPSSNISLHPRAPLYPASHHYPPELIPQSMRPAPSSSSSYPPSRYSREEESGIENNVMKKHELDSYREHERYIEHKEEREYRDREAEYHLRKERHLRQSPILHSHTTTRADMPSDEKGHMGSIIHGTPRDYVRRMSPPPVSAPLNLATNMMSAAENELVLEEELSAKIMKYRNKSVINGQLHYRSGNHPSGVNYRKENDNSSYKISYQIHPESHSKPPVTVANTENSVISASSKMMPYYVERDFQKSEQVETRTLSMASVINSQINGIFAREKFVSNNSYDFLNSFTSNPEKSIFSDSSQKHKTETKSALSVPEAYMSHSKSTNHKAPNQETSKFDGSSNKLPSFMLSDHSFPVNTNSSNYPPLLKAREPSITRALLQSPVVTSYESDVHSFEEPLPKVVSVLDSREDKLRELRKAGEMLDSDYSDPDSDEEDGERLKKLLKITKGPQPKSEPDPKKMKFLAIFGLITHLKKDMLEIKKCIRRRQAMREKSCSPVFEEPVKSSVIQYDLKHLSELSKRLCLEEDFPAKTDFLRMLGLIYITPEQKAEKENVMKVVENERLRRNGIIGPSQQCLELQGSHLGKRVSSIPSSPEQPDAKKPNLNTNQSESMKQEDPASSDKFVSKKNPVPLKPFKPSTSVPRLSAFLKPPFLRSANLPVPPLIPASQVIPLAAEPMREIGASVVVPKDPRVRQLNIKEFAQEFHNSVLQTTQMQLAEKKSLPTSIHVEAPFHKSPSSCPTPEKVEVLCEDYQPAFRWPGIEAIMESYECHTSEQNVERTFLVNNCQKLKALIQESNTEAECLGHKTEELMHEQKLLEKERQDLQTKVEALGLFIQHFR